MTPYKHPATARQRFYNTKHGQARSTVERAIGIWKSRFRCLLRERVMQFKPVKCGSIINVCAALHNICIARGADEVELLEDVQPVEENDIEDPEGNDNNLVLAEQIRNENCAQLGEVFGIVD